MTLSTPQNRATYPARLAAWVRWRRAVPARPWTPTTRPLGDGVQVEVWFELSPSAWDSGNAFVCEIAGPTGTFVADSLSIERQVFATSTGTLPPTTRRAQTYEFPRNFRPSAEWHQLPAGRYRVLWFIYEMRDGQSAPSLRLVAKDSFKRERRNV